MLFDVLCKWLKGYEAAMTAPVEFQDSPVIWN